MPLQLLYLGREEFQTHLGHLSEAFLQQAESTYSPQQADMPAWLVDAKKQKAFYEPEAITHQTGDENDIDRSSSFTAMSETAEAKTYKKKKEKKKAAGDGSAAEPAPAEQTKGDDAKKSKKKIGEKAKSEKTKKGKTEGSTSDGALALITAGDLDQLRDLLAGTFKNKYGSLAHAFAEMDVNNSAIVDLDVHR